jgi:hypothetical protein
LVVVDDERQGSNSLSRCLRGLISLLGVDEQRRDAMRNVCRLLVDDRCVAIVAKGLSRLDRAFPTPFTAGHFLESALASFVRC